MYPLIRRISSITTVNRVDRPWNEDATSNAPKKGRKRRLSIDEDEVDPVKKPKADTPSATPAAEEPPEVTKVSQGVKELELQEKDEVVPESVPLPDEVAGELDGSSPSPEQFPTGSPPSISSTPTDEYESTKEHGLPALVSEKEPKAPLEKDAPSEPAETDDSVEGAKDSS